MDNDSNSPTSLQCSPKHPVSLRQLNDSIRALLTERGWRYDATMGAWEHKTTRHFYVTLGYAISVELKDEATTPELSAATKGDVK